MDLSIINLELVVKLLLLLLIGMGPKIALVPFLEMTRHFDAETQGAVGRRMVVTALVTAIILFASGALLMRLLHITGGAVAVAGAIILAILAINMVSGPGKKVVAEPEVQDPKQIAGYPLAIPYLLNPVGITVLIVASGGGRLDRERRTRVGARRVGWGVRLRGLCQRRQAVKEPEPHQPDHL